MDGDDSDSDESKPLPRLKVKDRMDQLKYESQQLKSEWNATVKRKILNFMVFMFAPVCFIIFIIGSYDFFRNVEENKCQMTFMFEYPQYVKVPLDPAVSAKFPMYGLYAYAEGKHIEPARNFRFTGIPVLFLPGHAGSYKQVRSFASVALRKWLDSGTPFHFDFFSVDFNEEISGVYGYVLNRQSEYLKHVVAKIMGLYEDYHHVVLIGHSMGGIVAKSVNIEEATVNLIYTMATPNLHPPIITDPESDLFYYYIMRNWTHVAEHDKGNPVTVISVAGGDRDFLVSGKLTLWNHNAIHISATAIPSVWASTDHLCIVCCKQVVMVVVRTLFDLVEYNQKKKYYAITENSAIRTGVLDYHFRKRTSGKSFHSAHPVVTNEEKPPKTDWVEILTHNYCPDSISRPTYVMIPRITFQQKVKEGQPYEILVATENTKARNWIFGCKNQGIEQNTRYCTDLVNLSHRSSMLPSFHSMNRKIIHLDYELEVSKYSHLVVKLNTLNSRACVDVDVYRRKERFSYLGESIAGTNGALFYNFSFPVTFNQSKLFAWKMHVKLVKDDAGKEKSCPGHHNAVGIFEHGSFRTHNFLKNETLHVKFADTSATSGHVLLYLDRSCNFSIKVHLDYIGTAGQLFRVVGKLLPSYFASIILMSFFYQNSKGWTNFHWVLLSNAYYLSIVPGFIVAFTMVLFPNDYRYMLTEAEYSALLPIFCYLIAYALVVIISLGFWALTLGFGNGLHTVITKFIGKKLGSVPDKVTDLALGFTIDKFPLLLAVLVVSVAINTSGALGLALGFVLYILKIFKGYEDILEDLIRGRITSLGEGLSPVNFHTHCALLWLVVAAINVPSLVYWINNFKYSSSVNWDLSLYICLMLMPTVAVLWQENVPDFNPTMWSIQRYLCYVMGIVVVIYGTHRIYLISFVVTLVLTSLAICQFISALAKADETSPANNSNNTPTASPPNSPPPAPSSSQSQSSSSTLKHSQESKTSQESRTEKEDLENLVASSSTEDSDDSSSDSNNGKEND